MKDSCFLVSRPLSLTCGPASQPSQALRSDTSDIISLKVQDKLHKQGATVHQPNTVVQNQLWGTTNGAEGSLHCGFPSSLRFCSYVGRQEPSPAILTIWSFLILFIYIQWSRSLTIPPWMCCGYTVLSPWRNHKTLPFTVVLKETSLWTKAKEEARSALSSSLNCTCQPRSESRDLENSKMPSAWERGGTRCVHPHVEGKSTSEEKAKDSSPCRNIIRSLYQMVYGSLLEYTTGFMSCVTRWSLFTGDLQAACAGVTVIYRTQMVAGCPADL